MAASAAAAGGGAASIGDTPDFSNEHYYNTPTCSDLFGTVPNGCDIRNPPQLTTNGCTGTPDGLIVNGLPATSLGAIFTDACNQHDACYGAFLATKSKCDTNLGEDMVAFAQERILPAQWAYYEPHVRLQAATYASFLSTDFISMGKYEAAQIEGSCRANSQLLFYYGCIV